MTRKVRQNIESPPATLETRERNGRGRGGDGCCGNYLKGLTRVTGSARQDWVREAGGAQPVRGLRGPVEALGEGRQRPGLFGVSLPASSRCHCCFGGRASPLSFFTRRALPEATREKRGPS